MTTGYLHQPISWILGCDVYQRTESANLFDFGSGSYVGGCYSDTSVLSLVLSSSFLHTTKHPKGAVATGAVVCGNSGTNLYQNKEKTPIEHPNSVFFTGVTTLEWPLGLMELRRQPPKLKIASSSLAEVAGYLFALHKGVPESRPSEAVTGSLVRVGGGSQGHVAGRGVRGYGPGRGL